MGNLDSNLFPGVSSSVQVHEGFRNEHAITAPTILKEVKRLMLLKNTNNVTLVSLLPRYSFEPERLSSSRYLDRPFSRWRFGGT